MITPKEFKKMVKTHENNYGEIVDEWLKKVATTVTPEDGIFKNVFTPRAIPSHIFVKMLMERGFIAHEQATHVISFTTPPMDE